MKRSFSFEDDLPLALLAAGTGLIAVTYDLVRLAYGLFLPDVQAELGFGDAAAGLVAAGSSVVYCLGALAGFLAASRHPRRLVVAAAVAAGGGAAGMAAASGLVAFAASAVLGSAGAGLASPALVAIVRRNVPERANASAQAIVNAGTGPGLVVAGALALVLLPDWRLAWALVAGAACVVATLVLRLDCRRGAAPRDVSHGFVPPAAWFRAHRVVIVAAGLMGAGSAAVWTYGRAHLVQAGASEAVSVGAWVALGLGGTAVILTARRMGELRLATAWTVAVLTLAVGSAVLGAAPRVTPLALLACCAFGWGYTAGSGALIAWTTRLDPDRAAAGTSMLFVVLVLGQAIGAAATGALADGWGSTTALLVAAVVGAMAVGVPHRDGRPGAGRSVHDCPRCAAVPSGHDTETRIHRHRHP